MTDLLRDLRYAGRMLGKSPAQTAVAVIALGLGIGLATTSFSIAWGVLMRGLPFERSERILSLSTHDSAHPQNHGDVNPKDFAEFRSRQTSFESLAAYVNGTVNLSGAERPERFEGAFATANAFDVLRVRPFLGRTFRAGEDAPGSPVVALLSYGLWQSRYGGDPKVVGRAIRVNGQPAAVVGVMPPGFAFPFRERVWVSLKLDPARAERGKGQSFSVYGRLRDGVAPARAQAEMSAIAGTLAREYPQTNRDLLVRVESFISTAIGEQVAGLLWVLLGFGVVVLLIACANVASLMVARASTRTRELAIRSALGAGRRRVMLQLLLESTLLSAAGAVLGIALARLGVYLFNAALAVNVDNAPPFWIHIAVDGPALAFTLLLTLLSGLACGLFPAFQASRADVNSVLKDEGRGSTSLRIGWFSRLLVVGELAVCAMLLVGAGLMVKSVVKLQDLKLGFDSHDLLTVRVALFETQYPKPADRAAFFAELLRRLAAQPGVVSTAATASLPTSNADNDRYAVFGRSYPHPESMPRTYEAAVSPGFFSTLGTWIVTGRDFGTADRAGALPVALVNRSFAAREWPRESPLGKRIRIGVDDKEPWRTIVGVVPDLKMEGLSNADESPAGIYLPLAQDPPGFCSVVVRTHGDPLALLPVVRREVGGLNRDLPLYFIRTMRQVIEQNGFFLNLFGTVFGILGAAALVLASVGIYGVISFSVGQRTQEIGVRMALGARQASVLGMILRQGAMQLGTGLGIGLLLALGAARPLRTLLLDVQPTDPPTFVSVALVLSAVALAASYVPALRASRVDPLVAIHYD
jgi:putative ABC transport system permease protein